MKKKSYKILTIRLPVEIWKALKQAIIDEKIKSIQQAVVESLRGYLKIEVTSLSETEKKDALRYRWLREKYSMGKETYLAEGITTEKDLDEYIDQMRICWDYYWGWPKPVADIYDLALKKLDGWHSPLHFGPAHVVWEDGNFHSAEACLEDFDAEAKIWVDNHILGIDKDEGNKAMEIVKESLKALAAMPLSVRCVTPEDYDNEYPELYPPPKGIEMVKC